MTRLPLSVVALAALSALALAGCSKPAEPVAKPEAKAASQPAGEEIVVPTKGVFDADEGIAAYTAATEAATAAGVAQARKSFSPYAGKTYPTRPYFGDTHNHTMNSGDAFMAGAR